MIKIQMGSFSIPRGLVFVPYSSGVLESYIKNHPDAPETEFVLPMYDYDQLPADDIDVLGITCYVWSQDHIDAMTAEYKRTHPNCMILYGGPNIPVDPELWEEFAAERPHVDIFVAGSGEEIFLDILQNYPVVRAKWQRLDKTNRYKYETPTPYTDGTLDYFLNNEEKTFGGVLETNRGCPFKCAYCDWGDATGSVVSKFDEDTVYKTVDLMLDSKSINSIKIIDANWGMYERDLDLTKRMAEKKRDDVFISLCGTAKNSIKYVPEISKIFFKQNFGAENGHATPLKLGIQSWNLKTLEYNDRSNIKASHLEYLLNYYKENNIPYHSELILGLPGETPESWLYTLDKDFSHGVQSQAFHALEAVPNMPLLLNKKEEYQLEQHTFYAHMDALNHSGIKQYHRDRDAIFMDFDPKTQKLETVKKDVIKSCFSFTTEELLQMYDYTWFMMTFSNSKILSDMKKPSIEIEKFFSNLDNMPFWKERVEQHRACFREAMYGGKIRSMHAIRYWYRGLFRTDELMCVAENLEQAQDEMGRKFRPFKKSLKLYDYQYYIQDPKETDS